MKPVFSVASAALLASAVVVSDVKASEIPFEDVFIVVPWGPGGRTDTGTRIWANYFAETTGANVVVDNRPGGGGVIGARSLADSEPGSEIGVFSISHLIAQWTRIPPFQLDDYIPVALTFESPFVLAVAADSPYQTLADFVDAAGSEQLSISNSGSGTSGHIAAAVFASAAGIEVQHVPYEGDAGAIAALLSDEVKAIMAPMIGLASQVEGGAVRPLAVSQQEADVLHADIPTFAESGVQFVMGDVGGGIYLPAGTPEDVVAAWEDALRETFSNPELIADLEAFFIAVDFRGSDDFAELLNERNPELETIVDGLGLRLSE